MGAAFPGRVPTAKARAPIPSPPVSSPGRVELVAILPLDSILPGLRADEAPHRKSVPKDGYPPAYAVRRRALHAADSWIGNGVLGDSWGKSGCPGPSRAGGGNAD